MPSKMNKSIYQLKAIVTDEINKGNLEQALFLVKEFVEHIITDPLSVATIYGSLILDDLCQMIGRNVAVQNERYLSEKKIIKSDIIVYIATQLYMTGGHTAVIEDFIKLQPHREHLLIINDILSTPDREEIEKRFSFDNVVISWSPEGTLLEKLIWLQRQLYSLQPDRIFLFNHHQDSVAISAIQPDLSSEIFFYHHGDHHLCLGVHLDYTVHIDPHSMGFFNCRDRLGVKNNIYLPLVSYDLGVRSEEMQFMPDGKLRTCSSGSPHKFELSYFYRYEKLIPQILQITHGTHLHIGLLHAEMLEIIYQELENRGINRDRFIYIPWVKSVWQTIIDQKVDLYITSFPHVGLKAAIEVMGSGTPILVHDNYQSQLLGGRYVVYPDAFCWREIDTLLDYFSGIDKNTLIKQSTLARKHYEKYYEPSLLQHELSKIKGESIGLTPPLLESYRPDSLMVYFDFCNQFDRSFQKKSRAFQEEYRILQEKYQLLLEQYNAVGISTSWRITKPLRILGNFVRNIVNIGKKRSVNYTLQ